MRSLQTSTSQPWFCDLPTELLLQIASSLSQADLLSLARVCKLIRPVAEDMFYRQISLRRSFSGQQSPALALLSTLKRWPHLARKVISFSANIHPVDVVHKEDSSSPWCSFTPIIESEVYEPRVIGTLLAWMPSLKNLRIDARGIKPPASALENILGVAEAPVRKHLPSLAAFQHLTWLEWAQDEFDPALAYIPTLRTLVLRVASLPTPESWLADSQIEALYVNCDVGTLPAVRVQPLVPLYPTDQNLIGLLHHCPKLVRLYIRLSDWCDECHNRHHGSWHNAPTLGPAVFADIDRFVQDLASVAPNLLSLAIVEHMNMCPDFLQFFLPATTFCCLSKLQKLWVPQSAILGDRSEAEEPEGLHNLRSPATMLPSTLQYLRVYYPDALVFEFLESLSQDLDLKRLQDLMGIDVAAKTKGPGLPFDYDHQRTSREHPSMRELWNQSTIVNRLTGLIPNLQLLDMDSYDMEKIDSCTANLQRFLETLPGR